MVNLPTLDGSLDEPIYRQLYRYLRDAIASGTLGKGDRVPPTRELAGQLGLNRTTVAAAYALLETDGLIRGYVGRGSFVEGFPAPEGGGVWESKLPPILTNEANFTPTPGNLGDTGISFASSRPPEDLFPVDEFRVTVEEVLRSRELVSILQLGSPSGYSPLRSYLEDQARAQSLMGGDSDLMVTSGCQQALALVQQILTSSGDTVLLEDPVYPGLRNVFQRAGVRTVGIPVGAAGMDLDVLERTGARERAKVVVVTPNFQNPTGATMPLASRTALLRIARDLRLAIVENDIYGDLRYSGEPVPSLRQLDDRHDVIQLKSFSKIAFPGLRVGWVLGPRLVVARLTEAKQWTDLHTDHFSQAVLLRFALTGRLAAHLQRVLQAGAERLRAALSACERRLPAGSRFTRPQGGMSFWVRLAESLDTGQLLAGAEREGVTYLAGRHFAVSRPEPNAFRLSFAGVPPARIEAGIAILGQVFQSELERTRAAIRRHESVPAIV